MAAAAGEPDRWIAGGRSGAGTGRARGGARGHSRGSGDERRRKLAEVGQVVSSGEQGTGNRGQGTGERRQGREGRKNSRRLCLQLFSGSHDWQAVPWTDRAVVASRFRGHGVFGWAT